MGDIEESKYEPPDGLIVPADIVLPATMKLHYLIEKTATFISKHGLQMEILIKAKQANNPQFEFLSFDCPLNPYYKLLVSSIRSGKYIPADDKANETDSDDGSDDHYLHPSLLGNSKTNAKSTENDFNLPQLPRSIDENNAYSQLVKSIRQKVGQFDDDNHENQCHNDNSNPFSINENKNDTNYTKNIEEIGQQSLSILPLPPPEVERIIEKLAQYVAKNGQDFEQTIRQRNESRFEFINPGNIYHGHYIKKKLQILEEKRRQQAEEIIMNNNLKANGDASKTSNCKKPISFSLDKKKFVEGILSSCKDKSKDEAKSDDGSNDCKSDEDDDLGLDELLADSPESKESSISKEKQEERKRKAALFLNNLKQKNAADNTNCTNKQSNCDTSSIPSIEVKSHQDANYHRLHPSTPSRVSPDSESSDATGKKHSNGSKASALLPFIDSKDKDCLLEKNHDKSKSPDHSNTKHSHSHKHRRHKHNSSRSSRSHKKSKKRRSSSTGMIINSKNIHLILETLLFLKLSNANKLNLLSICYRYRLKLIVYKPLSQKKPP